MGGLAWVVTKYDQCGLPTPPKSFVWFLGANSETLPHILASGTTKDGLSRSLQEARVATPGHWYVNQGLTKEKKCGSVDQPKSDE
ncbi:hypothetical protein N7530_009194 [Penicillium desertorum]|uniref:Uncharacterized protein n=1 Tax=Penicillium desertorum TaxID=1303715 RepID=A0A9W9WI04_9EURO|nr:hypothetical protein N7530_009194 [Penicillium desertorum]